METKEKTIRKVYVFRGRILTVRNDDALMPNGDVRGREVVEHPGGVCVLPIRDDGTVLLVEQFRYPYMEDVLEAPAGKLEPGEDPFEAAKRELREETGMVATEWFDLGWDYPSPGYTNEIIRLYAARGLSDVGQELDDDEFLNVKKVSFTSALEMIYDNEIRDSKTAMAVLKYKDLLNLGKLDEKKI